jgi:hypothetical protein
MLLRKKERMKTCEESKPWSLLFGLNGFTYELIGRETNNILLRTWGYPTCQHVLKFPIFWLTPNHSGFDHIHQKLWSKIKSCIVV